MINMRSLTIFTMQYRAMIQVSAMQHARSFTVSVPFLRRVKVPRPSAPADVAEPANENHASQSQPSFAPGAQALPAPGRSRIMNVPVEYEGRIFTPFYHFPYIIAVRTVARLKLYQSILTTAMVPACIVAYSLGSLPLDGVYTAFFVNAVALTVLIITSHFFRRWIGKLYLDESGEYLLVSHLTFFGNRRNFVMKVADVEAIDNLDGSARNVWMGFQRLDQRVDPTEKFEKHYYWSLRFGGILDREKFVKVFGSVPK